MIGLCILVASLVGITGAFSEDLLKLQFPLYGLTEVAAREYAREKSSCNNQLKSVYYGIQKRERWALKMVSASAAPVSGLVWGKNYWLGSYSQCQWVFTSKHIAHTQPQTFGDVQPFRSTFYVGSFRERRKIKVDTESPESLIYLGLCLPTICTPSELEPLLVQWANSNTLLGQNLFNFSLKFERIRPIQRDFSGIFSPVSVGLGVVIAIVILLTLSGTLYDVYIWTPTKNKKTLNSQENSANNDINHLNNRNIRESSKLLNRDNNLNECCELKINNSQFKSMPIHVIKPETESNTKDPKENVFAQFALCFSVIENAKQLLNVPGVNKDLSVVHSVRFFGMASLIWLYLENYVKPNAGNTRTPNTIHNGYPENIIISSTFIFDTFFFTSGFLFAYKYYKNRKGSDSANLNFSIKMKVNEFGLAVAQRFLRFTPVYLIVIALTIIIIKISKQISLFDVQERADETCPKSWWRNIVYVNNLLRGDEMCLSWSWYLAADMQFFILGLILLILSTRFWKFISIGSIVLIVLSSLLAGYYGSQYFFIVQSQSTLFDHIYTSPLTRIGPYLIGMFTGYCIVHLRGKLILKKAILITCWLVGIVCFVWSLSGLNSNTSYISAALHAALSRIAWSFSLSWVIIASCTDNAGLIQPILSLLWWTPINKLFYSVYMLSPLVYITMILKAEASVNLDSFQTVAYFFGCLLIIYIIAFVFSLLVEIPLTNLRKKFIGQRHIQNQLN